MCMAQNRPFELQGHRGARGLVPENTIPAFIKAMDLGMHTLELDVCISQDGKVVVSHEPYFNPEISTDPKGNYVTKETQGNLYAMPYRQIKKYDVGLRGNPRFPEQMPMAVSKPLLSSVIKTVEKYAKEKGLKPPLYNIELKSLEEEYGISQPNPSEFSDLVYAVLEKAKILPRTTIQSFDFQILKKWQENFKNGSFQKVQLSALIEPFDNNEIDYNLEKLGFIPEIWSAYFLTLTKEKVAYLHSKKIRVIPWTVNELKDMHSVKKMGCDGLITDYPDRAKKVFL